MAVMKDTLTMLGEAKISVAQSALLANLRYPVFLILADSECIWIYIYIIIYMSVFTYTYFVYICISYIYVYIWSM